MGELVTAFTYISVTLELLRVFCHITRDKSQKIWGRFYTIYEVRDLKCLLHEVRLYLGSLVVVVSIGQVMYTLCMTV